MNSPEENSRPLDDGENFDGGLGKGVPADKDMEEGDEEKTEETNLPPAMPPGA